jgi:SAM-dependent methyltransferase
LRLNVCPTCWLVQTEDFADAEDLFDAEYAYFSSTSSTWLAHAAKYTQDMTARLGLNQSSLVIEVASNDGYLLKNFLAAGIPCIGIEPTLYTAAASEKLGIPVIKEFFGEALGSRLASAGQKADLIVGNNVYAHVPDINDFTRGLKALLKPEGCITLEFPHLMRLLEFKQFDTVYHEHFSYHSLYTVCRIFEAAGLRIWNVEELTTHGGSLRIYGCHADSNLANEKSVEVLLRTEAERGLQTMATYLNFQSDADRVKDDLLSFLLEVKRAGKTIAAYGAAAKGNTVLNYAGVKPDLLPFVCDAAPSKQNKFMPGSHIPILPQTVLVERRPDYLLILPWNLAAEVKQQNAMLALQGTRFVTAVPNLEIS